MKSEKLSVSNFYKQLSKSFKLQLRNQLLDYLEVNGTSEVKKINSLSSKTGISVVRFLCDLNRDVSDSI